MTILLLGVTACLMPARAQFGNVLKKAKETVKETVNKVSKEAESSTSSVAVGQEQIPGQASSGVLSESMRIALEKMRNENKRTAPLMWALAENADKGAGFYDDANPTPPNVMNHANFLVRIHTLSNDSIDRFKSAFDARHTENLEIVNALVNPDGSYKQEVYQELTGGNDLKLRKIQDEIARYESLIGQARQNLSVYSKIKTEQDGTVSISSLSVGRQYLGVRNGSPVFLMENLQGKEVITPIPSDIYEREIAKYAALLRLIRKEPPAEQYPEYTQGQLARQYIIMGQRNALNMR